MGHGAATLVYVALQASVGLVGCSQTCGNINCGSGITVAWSDGQLPEAAQLRLCVDGSCDPPTRAVEAVVDGADLQVSARAATGGHEVTVRLETLNPDGTVQRSIEGTGTKTGDCCPGVTFTPASDSRSLVP